MNKEYLAKRAAVFSGLTDTSAHVLVQADSASRAAAIPIPGIEVAGTSILDGSPFRLRASGKITTGSGGTATFLPGIYYVSSAALTTVTAGGTIMFGTASTALAASTSYPWMIEGIAVWDSTSQVLTGWYQQLVGIASGYTSPAIYISNTTASVSLDSTSAGQGFQFQFTMGTGRTGGTVTLTQFALEVL